MPTASRRSRIPTNELGAPGIVSNLDGWLDTWEQNPKLRWPHSVHVYDAMRNDAHIESGLDAIGLPIERSTWDLTPESVKGCDPAVVEHVRRDLGIPERGKILRRPRGGVDLDDTIRHALLQLVFGHMVFEQVYEIHDGRARLAKLAPRMPHTINGWGVGRHGAIEAIKQLVPRPNGMWDEVTIPIDRLVVFTRRQEGSDPTGRSILRSAYIHWDLKQKLIRVDALAAERHGTGVPVVTYDATQLTRKEALDIASNVRSGEFAGVSLEQGTADLDIKGVEGQLHDTLASVKYHDQEISRRMLAMFLDLGHDNGARSLGETFVDFFVMAQMSTANSIAKVINEHVIRDLVEHNWGPDEPYPLIACDEITADSDLTAESLYQLARGGYIIPDPELEAWFRKRYGMPASMIAAGARPPITTIEQAAIAAAADQPIDPETLAGLKARFARLSAGPRHVPSRP